MSSGVGIARFANRKLQSGKPGWNENASSTFTPTNDTTTAVDPSSSVIGTFTNNFNDTTSTASNDEFGFLGGSSMGGDDMFMMNVSDFSNELTVNDDSSDANDVLAKAMEQKNNTSSIGNGIGLFRDRAPQAALTVPTTGNRNWIENGSEEMTPLSKFSKHSAPSDSNVKATPNHGSMVNSQEGDVTGVTIVTQTTPDGRILPMPVHPSVSTPHFQNITDQDREPPVRDGLMTRISLHKSNDAQTMAPPPNRQSIVTPTSVKRDKGSEVTQLFPSTTVPLSHDSNQSATYSNKPSNFPGVVNALTNVANSDDSDVGGSGGTDDFHLQYQQFKTKIRDLHDLDQKYHDMMFEGKIYVDVATSKLLQLKCQMYQVTDQILQELDHVDKILREFMPAVIEDE